MSLWFCLLWSFFSLKTFSFLLNLIIYVLVIFSFSPKTVIFLWSYLRPSYPSLSRPSFSSCWFRSCIIKNFSNLFPFHWLDSFFSYMLFAISTVTLIFYWILHFLATCYSLHFPRFFISSYSPLNNTYYSFVEAFLHESSWAHQECKC